MKKIYMLALLAFSFIGSIIAQDTLEVTPGIGTLNDAITANGKNKIYKLTAGEWYQLSAPIENDSLTPLVIVGGAPATAGGMIATLQTGDDVSSVPFGNMFVSKGNITLVNIYFVNADLSGQVAANFLTQSTTEARIIVDRCVLHPIAAGSGIVGQSGKIKCYFTNNQVIDHGHQLNPNDGFTFNFDNTSGKGYDSLWIENNTFVCIGMCFVQGSFANNTNNVYAVNHNTFVFLKSQIDWQTRKMEQYWTNNLMFDLQTQPYCTIWQPMPGGDIAKPKPNLIYADTLPGETLPSTRPNFVEYNSHYRAPGFWSLLDTFNNFEAAKVPAVANRVYLYPLVWSKDSTDCREAQMFNSTGFPNFKYGNTITDLDPKWADATIYDHETKFIAWTKPATFIHALQEPATNYPDVSTWPQYWWIPSGDISNNSVWPVFNGKYTDAQTLTGAIEKGFPLGDLNWYPEYKAQWKAHYAEVWTHIKAGNTDVIDIGGPMGVSKVTADAFGIYPNPAHDYLYLKNAAKANISISSIDGRIVRSAKNVSQVNVSDLAHGIYVVTIASGTSVSTQKVLIQ